MSLFEPIFEALNRAQIRYVVVGGFAAVLHGHARLTADVDIVIDLSSEQARRAVETLVALGFRPRAPVDPLAFADPATRRQWASEKGMRVFALWDSANPMREVDLFAEHPMDFEELWRGSEVIELSGTAIRIASIADLIRLKRLAGRPQDLVDIEALERSFFVARRVAVADEPGDDRAQGDWEAGWEAHRIHQLTLALAATPAQRLAWLEEMIAVAWRVGALPKSRD